MNSIDYLFFLLVTHWGRVTHICVGKQTIIVSDNSLSPGRRQAIIWANDGILFIGPLEQTSVKFQSKFQHFIHKNSIESAVCEMASILSRPKCVKQSLTIGSDALQWRHNGCDGVSNHQPHDCLLNRLFGRRSKKTSKLRVTGLCVGNTPVTGEFQALKQQQQCVRPLI